MANPSPPTDEYLVHIESALRAYLDRGHEAGAAELTSIAGAIHWQPFRAAPLVGPPQSRAARVPRPAYDAMLSAATFWRDKFHCRYCGGRVVPTRLLMLVSSVYPEQIPFHKNWKRGYVHPVYWLRGGQADHVVPGHAGGDWSDPSNVVTACGGCNMRKRNRLLSEIGWQLLDMPASPDWDGLTSLYGPLWEAAGRPDGHRPWVSAFANLASPASPRL